LIDPKITQITIIKKDGIVRKEKDNRGKKKEFCCYNPLSKKKFDDGIKKKQNKNKK